MTAIPVMFGRLGSGTCWHYPVPVIFGPSFFMSSQKISAGLSQPDSPILGLGAAVEAPLAPAGRPGRAILPRDAYPEILRLRRNGRD